MNRAVFLDRDGVINRPVLRDGRPCAPTSLAELEFFPAVAEPLAALRRAGYRIIVVTNQPDVATGRQQRETVEAMHERIRRAFAVDDIKVCFHTDRDGCDCRKPKPGMLLKAAQEWSLDLERCFMIGDTWRDVGAGRAARCGTIRLDLGYPEPAPPTMEAEADAVVRSLEEACALILSGQPLSGPQRARR